MMSSGIPVCPWTRQAGTNVLSLCVSQQDFGIMTLHCRMRTKQQACAGRGMLLSSVVPSGPSNAKEVGPNQSGRSKSLVLLFQVIVEVSVDISICKGNMLASQPLMQTLELLTWRVPRGFSSLCPALLRVWGLLKKIPQ